MLYKLVWKGETIESDLDYETAQYLQSEYMIAFNGYVAIIGQGV